MHTPLRLIEHRLLAPRVLHLAFEHAHGQPLPYKPGQFIQLFFPNAEGELLRRSYSIANPAPADAAPMRWELAVSLHPDGQASRFLQQLSVGDTLDAGGPFGRFHLLPSDAPRRILLIATGTGVAPYRAMLTELRQHLQRGTQVVLICGARRLEGLLYRDEFLALAAQETGFRYFGCLSQAANSWPENAAPDLVAGRVQTVLLAQQPTPDDLALLCGNPAMVDDCAALLGEAGLPLRAIRRERYVSSG